MAGKLCLMHGMNNKTRNIKKLLENQLMFLGLTLWATIEMLDIEFQM